jgi:predicted nucleic acid-binding protein
MILLDANVVLRSVQPGHSQFAVAVSAVKTARMLGYIPSLVPQVLYEYWAVATRPAIDNGLGMPPTRAEHEVSRMIREFQLFRDERGIFDRWRSLATKYDVRGKPTHDARLVAAMNRHGIRHLLTFNDNDFKRFDEITVVNPAGIDALKPT